MHQWPTHAAHSMSNAEMPNATSWTLINRIKVRDNDAWERLVILYTPFLHYWCRRWGVSRADADDVLQEVFQAISKNLKNFRRERAGDSFRGWLRGIARNKVLSLGRRRDPPAPGGTEFYRQSLLIPDPAADARSDSDAADDEAVGILYEHALKIVRSEFEERTWQAFWRTVVDGQAPAIIADDLGVTAAAVRQAKSRVLRRLKDLLAEPTSSLKSPV
jgi:RNA polymerase sigma-70 factor (ECF subfamily)